jgi:hypothetical protein
MVIICTTRIYVEEVCILSSESFSVSHVILRIKTTNFPYSSNTLVCVIRTPCVFCEVGIDNKYYLDMR